MFMFYQDVLVIKYEITIDVYHLKVLITASFGKVRFGIELG